MNAITNNTKLTALFALETEARNLVEAVEALLFTHHDRDRIEWVLDRALSRQGRRGEQIDWMLERIQS